MFSPLSGWWKEFYVYGKMKANKSAEVFCDFFFYGHIYLPNDDTLYPVIVSSMETTHVTDKPKEEILLHKFSLFSPT